MKFPQILLVLLALSISTSFVSCTSSSDQGGETAVVDIPEIPLEDFFKNPETFRYRLSPDGEHISWLAPYESRLNVHYKKVGTDEVKRITSETDRDIGGYDWANNDQIVYLKDDGGDENFRLYVTDIASDAATCLTPFEGTRTIIMDEMYDDEDHLMISINKNNPQVFEPFKVNLRSGELEQLAENPGNITNWVADHSGVIRMAVETDGVNNTYLYRETADEAFAPLFSTNFKENFSPLFFTFDNERIYASSNLGGRDKSAIVEFDPNENKEVAELYINETYDTEGLSYSNKRKVLTHASFVSWKPEKHFFDEEIKGVYARLESELPGYDIEVLASTRDEGKYMAVTTGDRSMPVYYIYDKATDAVELVAVTTPWLNEEHMAEMKPISYQSRDGLTINGYLTVPVGVDARNLPVVVNPHGGPWARDVWGFNPEIQFLANRGYAVFQMNFRGSTGYGREFWESSFREWGKKMQDDITDGVQWLIDEGIADPERISIYGASYGGYATLAGLTYTPDLYACGVDYVGVSNMFTFMNTIPPYWEPFRLMFYEMVGNPDEDSLALAEVSPALHADNITAPLFIAQGAKDPRVNKAESDQMVEALKARGVEVEYMVKDNEGHGFANEENRFEFYKAMEQFLSEHIGNTEKADS